MSERGAAAPPPAMAVTEHQLAHALNSLLHESNASTTISGIIEQLESKFGVNLVHKIDFIRSQIHQFLLLRQSHHHNVMPHYPHQKDHFAIHQNPNFHPSPPAHLPPNFAARHPVEGYGFRPPPPPQPVPQPHPSQSPPPAPVTVVNTTGTAVSASASARVSAKESASTVKKRRGGPGGLNKLCSVSPLLQTIVGQPSLTRTEIVKQLWAYIKKHNLQDPNNKRTIICNDELRLVFETDSTDMFKMNKLLAKHITALEPTKQMAKDAKKRKVDVESVTDNPVPIVMISDALAIFFGTDEKEMSQAEVLRQIWEYIKVHQLEDPINSTVILCDEKLHEILGCESISALEIPATLSQRHLFKK